MDDGVILVLTCLEDSSADMVIGHLIAQGAQVARFDPGIEFPSRAIVSSVFGAGPPRGRLVTATRQVDLERVRAVYYRRPTPYPTPPASQAATFVSREAKFGLGGILATLPCRYVSHPWTLLAAEHKPLQLSAAQRAGFAVPATLMTNDVEEARAFAAEHGQLVYKPLRGGSYTGADGEPCTIWTSPVQLGDLDDGIGHTIHQFQARVDKTADLRVTVAGGQVFCVRLDSRLLDWRADYEGITYTVIAPPAGLPDKCFAFLAELGLPFGAFDFALTEDGPVFLECNPNGQWGWIEDETGLPIARAIADLLLEDPT
ncbi:ATP-grasp ribosomal peptide maturase [Nonomuraea longicatena]|uniref:ATP-grasp ribosomal peptide maturase n=1 Tax=Nonomuraea longicatena TaxID=83682 RepID=A0ABN1NU46_9ACTN